MRRATGFDGLEVMVVPCPGLVKRHHGPPEFAQVAAPSDLFVFEFAQVATPCVRSVRKSSQVAVAGGPRIAQRGTLTTLWSAREGRH